MTKELTAYTDQRLVESFLGGEPRAFGELVRRYRRAMLSAAQRRLGDPNSAEDAVQDTWLQGFRYLSSFDTTRNFRTWLWTILLRQCAHTGRRLHRQSGPTSGPHLESVATHDAPSERLDGLERFEEVRLMLSRLPPGQSEAIRLRFLDGLPFQQIAERLGCSLAAAKQRVRAGLLRLSQEVQRTSTGDLGGGVVHRGASHRGAAPPGGGDAADFGSGRPRT